MTRSCYCIKKDVSISQVRTGWKKSRIVDLAVISRSQVIDSLEKTAICEIPPLLAIEIVTALLTTVRDSRIPSLPCLPSLFCPRWIPKTL
jgi:hypothetical protein